MGNGESQIRSPEDITEEEYLEYMEHTRETREENKREAQQRYSHRRQLMNSPMVNTIINRLPSRSFTSTRSNSESHSHSYGQRSHALHESDERNHNYHHRSPQHTQQSHHPQQSHQLQQSHHSRQSHHSQQPHHSQQSHHHSQNQTINVTMYQTQRQNTKTSTTRPHVSTDPSRMAESLKVEEADWETKWENDNESEEDEEKDNVAEPYHSPAVAMAANVAARGASQHPFRPGMDGGHSSFSTMNQHHASNRAAAHSSNRPRAFNKSDALSGDNTDARFTETESDGNLEDRPGFRTFSMLRVLGKGSFGKVVLVRKRSGQDRGKLFAMKILKKSHLIRKNQIERTRNERRILSIVDNPFIMKLFFAFQTPDKVYFVLEYCSGGELFFHLSRNRRFPERVALFYAAELLIAIGHLHRRGIIYRDLKPENVLLDAAGHVKLGDFGLSKDKIWDPCKGTRSVCGTPEYMAPEVIRRKEHGFCVDYWGLGMLVYEMMTSLPPWYTTDRSVLEHRILTSPLDIPDYMNGTSVNFVSALLERNPHRRLGVRGYRSVMDHSFFTEIDWRALKFKRVEPPIKPCEGWRANLDEAEQSAYNTGNNLDRDNMANPDLTDNQLDRVTSNFSTRFTRMPLNTEDQGINHQYSDEELSDNAFVGFSYDARGNTKSNTNNTSNARVTHPTTS